MQKKFTQVILLIFISGLFFVLPASVSASNINADGNDDCVVDGLDYVTWLNNYGKTTDQGKKAGNFSYANGDTMVDGIDYVLWLNQYQKTCFDAKGLLQNSGFEDGVAGATANDLDAKKYLTVEGETARGTGRETKSEPALVQVLCGKSAPAKPLSGNCLLKIKSKIGIKAMSEQSYYPTVIDGTFVQNMGIYVPDIAENNNYVQQMELREGVIPGAAGEVLQIRYTSKDLQICVRRSDTGRECKTFAPFSKNEWHNLKINAAKISAGGEEWSIKIEDTLKNKTYWDSAKGNGVHLELKEIPRERILPQIGTLFFGDECLGSGPQVAGGCDGVGTIYYDDLNAQNPGGTGRYNVVIPGDADGNKVIDENDLLIWKVNYIKILNGETVIPANETGDFRHDNQIDGLDYATWYNRSGQKVQE